MLCSNVKQRFRCSLSHFIQKSSVFRACYFGATFKVISVEAHEWFCLCPYLKVYIVLCFSFFHLWVYGSKWRLVHLHLSLDLPSYTGDVLCQVLPWHETWLHTLYSCHLQSTQQLSNLIRRFKVMSSFSIDFSANVHAGCGPFEHNGEDQRIWMLMFCL